jgi:oxaloacetate decarboxylase alpha subunit
MKEITFIDTTVRDGQMSLWATAMRTDMILPVADAMDQAGFAAIEIMAAGFEKKLARDLGESLWYRVKSVRQRIRETPLRLIRGRHLEAFQITPESVERVWWDRVAAYGIREARLADSSNTVSFLKVLIDNARRVGIRPIANLIFSISPRHTDEYYAAKAREIAALQPDRICMKDPGGLLTPERTRSLLPIVLQNVGDIPVEFHTHCVTGLGTIACLEAIKLGIRFVNCAIPPLADGSSNPSVFDVARNARIFGYTTTLREEPLRRVSAHFTAIAKRERLPIGRPAAYDAEQYVHQVPGGMISNLRFQLSSVGLGDRLPDALAETARVRADLGYPIMVTPYSQFVGVQAVMNIVAGERYREVSNEVIQYALGKWGKEESDAIDSDVKDRILSSPRAKALARTEPAQPSWAEIRQRHGGAQVSDDEMLLLYLAGSNALASIQETQVRRRAHGGGSIAGLIDKLAGLQKVSYVQVKRRSTSVTLAATAQLSSKLKALEGQDATWETLSKAEEE